MHAFTPAEIHAETHAARTTALAAEAAAWRLARGSGPAAQASPVLAVSPALRNRIGEALVGAGIRLMQPEHVHARITRAPHAAA
ncbi:MULTISPECIES: hypothetical protein [unclassified Streptomyces]|uniref:hypothetical protein n=1 Tax=unclassified Streptomyces TaxID=2593676 RepID=UPI002E11378A|nr:MULTISPECIES: hypothetical protein [unclassified Streptomyces]WSR26239.1 hypothetical protein OG573_08885 [Streptomyces sp. NBC_01205]